MRNRPKWYSIVLVGLVFLLASSVVGCQAPTEDTVAKLEERITTLEEELLEQEASIQALQHEIQETRNKIEQLEKAQGEVTSLAITEAKVLRVIDGDTIEVDLNGTTYKVRYIGIDTPETVHPSKPVECFGKEASDKNKELVEGKIVRLKKDVSETDRYGRLLRYVWVGEIFVNDYLVRQGYAYAYTYPPDVKYAEQFAQAQREAEENSRGLWAVCRDITIPPPAESLFLEIKSVTSPLSPGAYATLKARASPDAQCTITVYYKSGPSKAQGLYRKQADSHGDVSWTWKVGTRTTPGSWRIVVKATYEGKTASQQTYFTVR